LTFSTNQKGVLSDFPKVVERMVKQLFGHQLRINQSKTAFSSKRHNRHVTGVTITNEATLSLGRERKRYIKHLVHQYTLHKLDKADGYHLQGLLSFAKHIEPTFIEALNRKYTPLIIQQIIKTVYGQKAQENPPS
jgi:RNA-directed DNA polymerase